ncbi:hemagglutinin, partial [Paraburkholderia aspalathi]
MDNVTAIGSSAGALSANATAIGTNATVAGDSDSGVAIGYTARAGSDNTLAIGSKSKTMASKAIAIGAGALATVDAAGSMALGTGATVSTTNSVALGANSTADRVNTVSVGSSSAQRQIVNMQAGTANTDAVNVSQLKGVTDAIGGGAGVDANGKITKPAFTVGGQTFTDVGSALAAVATGGSADGVSYDTTKHDKVTLGGVGSTTPVTVANVAKGVADNDAVNVKQLTDAGLSVDTSGNVKNSFVAYDDTTKN